MYALIDILNIQKIIVANEQETYKQHTQNLGPTNTIEYTVPKDYILNHRK